MWMNLFAEALEIAKKYIAQRTRAFQPQSIQCRPEWVHPNNYWEFSEPSPKKVRPCWVVVYTADGNLLEVWIDIEKMVCVGGDRTRGLNRPGDR